MPNDEKRKLETIDQTLGTRVVNQSDWNKYLPFGIYKFKNTKWAHHLTPENHLRAQNVVDSI